ncbi:MAG: tRNA lysidine(34) synthetase TilS [Candidatus Aminicenantes bacterium]|nr:tRNA lysidine(34) synthetase TilS [Candidatus Aminicenantes bacterium]
MAPKKPPLVAQFRKTIECRGLVRPGDRILIAFSGGPDSTALLSLFLAVRGELRLKLALAHFNHRLRPAAREDEAFARLTAKKLNLPIAVGSGNVRAYAARRRMNLEEAGRELRYAFFKNAAKKLGADKIATGHTADDQAETVLMRLLRGTGLRGLGGIRPLAEGGVIRPLLEIERKDIARWLAAQRLDFRTDESNLDLRFFRNRIRHEVLPLLKRIEPKAVSQLGRLALILQDEEDLRTGPEGERGRSSLDAESLSRLPKALARRAVRGFLARLAGSTRGFTFNDVEAVLALAEGKVLTLRGGLNLRRDKGLIAVKPPAVDKARFRYLWDGRGVLKIKETGLAIKGRILEFRGTLPAPFDDPSRAFLDADKLEFPLLVRNREEGDRFRPLGAPGSKKLKEILRAKGIPADERDRLPVILTGTCSKARNVERPPRIVWMPGLPVGDAFKVGRASNRILWIERVA